MDLDSAGASEMPAAQPKTPARQLHVSGADHVEQSDVSAVLAKFIKAHTPEKSGSTPTLRRPKRLQSKISDFRTIIKLQCNLEHSNCEHLNCEHSNIEFHLSVSVKLASRAPGGPPDPVPPIADPVVPLGGRQTQYRL